MREVYKNPMLYYVLIPVLVGLWPLLVWGVYLPRAEQRREIEGSLCVQGQTHVIDILRLDSDRLNMMDKTKGPVEFTYGSAIDRVANLCRIPSSDYDVNAGPRQPISGGKVRQDARLKLTNVTIVQAAQFLSTIQSMWSLLTCESIKLTKKKGMPDQWDVDFRFLYYY
ncbi:MAG: hypothetical protein FJ280_15725 [Planctomycetes bacterium]|nr:hypothetical protein [Planctomycetota bacterium]